MSYLKIVIDVNENFKYNFKEADQVDSLQSYT